MRLSHRKTAAAHAGPRASRFQRQTKKEFLLTDMQNTPKMTWNGVQSCQSCWGTLVIPMRSIGTNSGALISVNCRTPKLYTCAGSTLGRWKASHALETEALLAQLISRLTHVYHSSRTTHHIQRTQLALSGCLPLLYQPVKFNALIWCKCKLSNLSDPIKRIMRLGLNYLLKLSLHFNLTDVWTCLHSRSRLSTPCCITGAG